MNLKQWIKKNKKWIFSVTLTLLAASAVLVLLLALTPTGGRDKLHLSISAEDFFSEQKLELPYLNRGEFHGIASTFEAKDDLSELAAHIQKQQKDAAETQLFGGNHLLIWGKNPTVCWMIFRQDADHYLFFDMAAQLVDGAADSIPVRFVLPYHFVPLAKQNVIAYHLEAGTLYETTAEKQDFLDFYRRLGQYTVTETPDGFLLASGEHLRSKLVETPIKFQFTTQNGKAFVSLEQS